MGTILATGFICFFIGVLLGHYIGSADEYERSPKYIIEGEKVIKIPAIGEMVWILDASGPIQVEVRSFELRCQGKSWYETIKLSHPGYSSSVDRKFHQIYKTKEELINSL